MPLPTLEVGGKTAWIRATVSPVRGHGTVPPTVARGGSAGARAPQWRLWGWRPFCAVTLAEGLSCHPRSSPTSCAGAGGPLPREGGHDGWRRRPLCTALIHPKRFPQGDERFRGA
ncbi:hypothetical protein NN561_017634 [Cricetulus griseus]